ncbi:hypothetical protein MAR_014518 [Mya arenaria]|uniref:Uncharacterized protein n=1 Tax=Mya arenaria TaxID=6604 RepID=A0ABY7G5M6_MYAAR|nr:hypothetical protein MAR_014518 [Mya arenaria]
METKLMFVIMYITLTHFINALRLNCTGYKPYLCMKLRTKINRGLRKKIFLKINIILENILAYEINMEFLKGNAMKMYTKAMKIESVTTGLFQTINEDNVYKHHKQVDILYLTC